MPFQEAPLIDPALRPLLIRTATSAIYLKVSEGQRFVARLLAADSPAGDDTTYCGDGSHSHDDVDNEGDERDSDARTGLVDAVHAALLSMLPVVRKSRATAVGTVYVHAWKAMGSDRFAPFLEDIVTKATHAATDPLATNIRTVLSAFHANKRIAGMDAMLHAVYTPILFRSLHVANPLVRRNASIILADAFPIHNPAMPIVELEATLGEQCKKIHSLLQDPAPLVRVAAVEGACRVLGLLWEIVPYGTAKRIIDVITGKLAFDKTSSNVRIAVCDGLRFMLDNHQTHPLLSVALRRLGNLLHDKIDRVRIAFLDLLITLKAKRILSARYFDVAPVDDFVLRLSFDVPAVTTRVMQLLVSSYFPLERKNKTPEQIAASQVRACLEIINQGHEAAITFYSNLSMYVPPGPLVEFCLRLASVALIDDDDIAAGTGSSRHLVGGSPSNRRRRGRSPRRQICTAPAGAAPSAGTNSVIDRRGTMLGIIANILKSIKPSLAKPGNADLRTCVIEIFGGGSLSPLLISRGYSTKTRVGAMMIAASMPASIVTPVVSIWRHQLAGVFNSCCGIGGNSNVDTEHLRGLLYCGLSWGDSNVLGDIMSSWADIGLSGRSFATSIVTASKRTKRGSKPLLDQSTCTGAPSEKNLIGAAGALLCVCKELVEDDALRSLLVAVISDECDKKGAEVAKSSANAVEWTDERNITGGLRVVFAATRGAIAVLDSFIEDDQVGTDDNDHGQSGPATALACLASAMRLSVVIALSSSDFGSTGAQFNLLEVLQWASGKELLSSAFRAKGYEFGSALTNVVVTLATDAAALGILSSAVGVKYLSRFVSHVAEQCANELHHHEQLRFALSALTAAYHLMQPSVFSLPVDDAVKGPSLPPRASVDVDSLVSTAADMLSTCSLGDEVASNEIDTSVSRFTDVLLAYCYPDDGTGLDYCGAAAAALARPLATSFSRDSNTPLVTLLSRSVVALADKPRRGAPPTCAASIVTSIAAVLCTSSHVDAAKFVDCIASALAESIHTNVSSSDLSTVGRVCAELDTWLCNLTSVISVDTASDAATKDTLGRAGRAVECLKGLLPIKGQAIAENILGADADGYATAMMPGSTGTVSACI
jgi:Condensin II non structural maintenance of chromosomes subunit